MSAVVFAVVAWLGAGTLFYHVARSSWNARWGDDSAPFNYPIGAVFGLISVGFVFAEISIRLGQRK